MLERLIEDTARNLDLPSRKIEQLSGLLIALIFDRRHGGFAGFSASLQKLGLQDAFASWSSVGHNQSITFGEAKEIFGVPLVAAIGGKLGIGSVMTTRAICCLLPGFIEALPREGEAPLAIPDSLRSRSNATLEWLHEVDAAGWVTWRDNGLMSPQDLGFSQPKRTFCNEKPDEMPRLA